MLVYPGGRAAEAADHKVFVVARVPDAVRRAGTQREVARARDDDRRGAVGRAREGEESEEESCEEGAAAPRFILPPGG
jgi:hypothetical protein